MLPTGIPAVEVGEILNSKRPDAWQQGIHQLHRSLKATAYALKHTAPILGRFLPPEFETGELKMIGYLCVPCAADKDVAKDLK